MPKMKNVYPRGHFFQQLAGGHEVSAAAMVDERGFFGLERSATFLYGNLRRDDGAMFEIVRRFSHHAGHVAEAGTAAAEAIAKPPALMLFQTTELDDANLRYDLARMQRQATTDDARIFMEGGDAVWLPAEGAAGNPFRISFNEEKCVWHEEGLLSLTGAMLKPGLQWYLPGRDYGTFYVSQFFQVEGEVEGRPVTGMIAFDQSYMGAGGALYVAKDLVMENRAHVVWYTWATRYDDGSWEGGHFMLGHGPLGFALFTDGTTIVSTRDITGRVTPRAGSPFAQAIDLTIDGEEWEFLPDPKGMMPDMMRKHPPTPQQEGRWQRVGETRTPLVWFAWGETEPDHGYAPMDRLPTEPITLG